MPTNVSLHSARITRGTDRSLQERVAFHKRPIRHLRSLVVMPVMAQLLLIFLAAFGSLVAGQDVQSRGRVCLSVVEKGPPAKETPFRTKLMAGPGGKVNIYLDASTKCVVLLAALTKDGRLANGWRPQISDLPEDFEEIQLPREPVTWDWTPQAAPLDIYVVFMQPDSPDAEAGKKLVSAMQPLKMDDRLLEMQTNKLRELIGRITSETQKTNQTVFKDPEVGGVFRGAEFPWRQFAQSVSFGDGRPGVLICAGEGPGKAVPVAQ